MKPLVITGLLLLALPVSVDGILFERNLLKQVPIPFRAATDLPALAVGQPPHYRLLWLDKRFLSGPALLINDTGKIAGTLVVGQNTEGEIERAGICVSDGRAVGKVHLLTGFSGNQYRQQSAHGINRLGDVVGTAGDTSDGAILVSSFSSVYWQDGSKGRALASVERHGFGVANAINRFREVVFSAGFGSPMDANRPEEDLTGQARRPESLVVFWNGKYLPLGPGMANAINDRGEVVGEREDLAVLWRGEKCIVLGKGSAVSINNRSEVAVNGRVEEDSSPKQHAYLWRDGGVARLPILSGMEGSEVSAINDREQVVGSCGDRDGSSACLWQHGRVYDLNRRVSAPKGWHLDTAAGINNKGWIVGVAHQIKDESAPERAFLLIPQNIEQ